MRSLVAALLAGVSRRAAGADPVGRGLDAAVASRFAKQALDCVERSSPTSPTT